MTVPIKELFDNKFIRPDSCNSIPRDPNLIWLDKNECFDPEFNIFTRSLLNDLPGDTLYTYPEMSSLYKKIAYLTDCEIESHLLTHGSDGAIRLVFQAFVQPGDIVLHTNPTFAMYSVYCKMFGANEILINYQNSLEGPIIDFTFLKTLIIEKRPKLFCLPNPDSPTGTIFKYEEIIELIELCNSCNTIMLIDEAYHPFYEKTYITYTKKFKNLIVARTFAKAWGLAGLRIGYLVSHPEISIFMKKLRPMYEVGTISVNFMNLMLDHVDEMHKSVNRLLEGKKYFLKELQKLNFKTLDTKGNFVHVNFGDNSNLIHAKLENIVLYRKNFTEVSLSGFSRFTLTTREIFTKIITDISCL